MPSFKDFEKIADFLEEQSRTFPSLQSNPSQIGN